ncbi:MAG: ribosome biogenesis GTP-binding protein YihA/YsxC [Ruminococcus sp.]|nr:ribosome biogenesis GTP-binding protein YihA/YsxC [Ruminococcus sp.]
MNFNEVNFEFAAGRVDQLPKSDMPEIVFSGHSNVGKSSLINKLVQRKALARVSSQPGKTATINFYRLREFRLVDLPGYGYAKVSKTEKQKWAALVEGYFAQGRNTALVIQILDMRHPPTDDDLHMIDFLYRSGFKFAAVLTKCDKLNKTNYAKQLEYYQDIFSTIENVPLITFSAQTGFGNDDVKKLIEKCVNEFNAQEVE